MFSADFNRFQLISLECLSAGFMFLRASSSSFNSSSWFPEHLGHQREDPHPQKGGERRCHHHRRQPKQSDHTLRSGTWKKHQTFTALSTAKNIMDRNDPVDMARHVLARKLLYIILILIYLQFIRTINKLPSRRYKSTNGQVESSAARLGTNFQQREVHLGWLL